VNTLQPTFGLLLCWLDEYILIVCSLSAAVRSEEYKYALVVIFTISFSIGCGSGPDIIKYQHSSKPEPLVAILKYSNNR